MNITSRSRNKCYQHPEIVPITCLMKLSIFCFLEHNNQSYFKLSYLIIAIFDFLGLFILFLVDFIFRVASEFTEKLSGKYRGLPYTLFPQISTDSPHHHLALEWCIFTFSESGTDMSSSPKVHSLHIGNIL